MRLSGDEEPEEGFNLTPLVDVVFLLLIFFLTATTFQKDEVEMDLELPEATSGAPRGASDVLVIQVAKDGTLLADGRSVTLQALRQKLKAAAARNKDQKVSIRGDRRTQFGPVATVLDACRSAKLRSISILADPIPGDGGAAPQGRGR